MIAELSLPVRYAETDAMSVVHHSNYIIWFEAGRVEFMRRAGIPYDEVERSGIYLTVSEVHARYLASARFGDTVVVRTRLSELRSRGVRFDYEVIGNAGKLLVDGYTRHICIDHSGNVARIPEPLLAQLRAIDGAG
jgi:acyl-CoA thioester hydrolase